MLSKTEVRGVVLEELHAVLEGDTDEAPVLPDAEGLHEPGLNSPALAGLLILPEKAMGTDPFLAGDLARSDMWSADGLAAVHERAASGEAPGRNVDGDTR